MLRLLRFTAAEYELSTPPASLRRLWPRTRENSPPGGSTLITVAPASASSWVQ